jgi:hypothetical protein
MNKVTYLLGAGASCKSLPMVEDFAERLSKFNDVLWQRVTYADAPTQGFTYKMIDLPSPRNTLEKKLEESLTWLGNETKRHASIDTYAKKLFIRNDKEAQENLHKLKTTLSCYLLLEQSLNPVDKRYDSFFASVLTRKPAGIPTLPEAVNIVTWNYDTQLEKSYKEFCEDSAFVFEGITKAHNIIRLNGVCGQPYKTEARNLCHIDFSSSFFASVLNLFKNHMDNAVGYRPSISFAWEREDLAANITERIKETTTLVVIGYSLPYFNRDIDRVLFEIMAPTLEKIFIQVPESAHPGTQERFLTLCKDESVKKVIRDKIEMLAGTDLFYIPDNMPG